MLNCTSGELDRRLKPGLRVSCERHATVNATVARLSHERQCDRHEIVTRASHERHTSVNVTVTRLSRARHTSVNVTVMKLSRDYQRDRQGLLRETSTQLSCEQQRDQQLSAERASKHAYDNNEEETWAADLWRCLRFVDGRAAHSNRQQNLSENHQPNTSAVPVSDAFGQSVLSKAALPVALRATPSPGQ